MLQLGENCLYIDYVRNLPEVVLAQNFKNVQNQEKRKTDSCKRKFNPRNQ